MNERELPLPQHFVPKNENIGTGLSIQVDMILSGFIAIKNILKCKKKVYLTSLNLSRTAWAHTMFQQKIQSLSSLLQRHNITLLT